MKRTIIVLKGKQNSGKSQTLFNLFDKYTSLTNVCIIKNRTKRSKKEFKLVVFIYKGVVIGITTYGDIPKMIKKILKELLDKYNCKILICACHNTVKSLTAFTRLNKLENWDINFIQKRIGNNKAEMNSSNMYDTNKIFSLVRKIIIT